MGVATAELSSSKGDVLAITLDTAADWMRRGDEPTYKENEIW